MSLIVADVTLELITALRPLRPRIRKHSKSLHDQLVSASDSIALNISEAELSDPGTRRARFFTAAGSANDAPRDPRRGKTLMALRVAAAWGYIAAHESEHAVVLLRRIIAMLWKLSRG